MSSALLPNDRPAVGPLLPPPASIDHGITSRAILTAPGLRVTLFHFAAGQELSEHTTPARALIQVLSGRCEFTLPAGRQALATGDLLHLPPGLPHAVQATEDVTLLITQATPPVPAKLSRS
jgi:quercetin dioxygenase-like cupin family protein